MALWLSCVIILGQVQHVCRSRLHEARFAESTLIGNRQAEAVVSRDDGVGSCSKANATTGSCVVRASSPGYARAGSSCSPCGWLFYGAKIHLRLHLFSLASRVRWRWLGRARAQRRRRGSICSGGSSFLHGCPRTRGIGSRPAETAKSNDSGSGVNAGMGVEFLAAGPAATHTHPPGAAQRKWCREISDTGQQEERGFLLAGGFR